MIRTNIIIYNTTFRYFIIIRVPAIYKKNHETFSVEIILQVPI